MTRIPTDFSLAVDDSITLCLPTVDEAETLFALVDKNRDHLREFLGWVDGSKKVADTRQFIEEGLSQWLNLSSLHLSIWKRDQLIGAVGLHNIDFLNHSTSAGYWLDKEHEGQGIMTKSVKTLIDYAFQILNLHRIEIRCAVHNIQSQKIPERFGFQKEGVVREAIHHYGEYFDAYLYGLIASTAQENKS